MPDQEELYVRLAKAINRVEIEEPFDNAYGKSVWQELLTDVLKKCREAIRNEIFKEPRKGDDG